MCKTGFVERRNRINRSLQIIRLAALDKEKKANEENKMAIQRLKEANVGAEALAKEIQVSRLIGKKTHLS